MTNEDKNARSKPLLRRYKDEDGNEMIAVAAWFYDEMVSCLPDDKFAAINPASPITDSDKRKTLKSLEIIETEIGMIFHTAFRKGTDSEKSSQVWKLINEMTDDWVAVVEFVQYCLKPHFDEIRAALTPKADAPEAVEGLDEPDLAFTDGPEPGKFYPILKFDSKEHYTAWMDAARRYRTTQDVAKIAEGLKIEWYQNHDRKELHEIYNEALDDLAAALSGKGGVE